MAPGGENPRQRGREHQGQTEAESCPGTSPVRPRRWHARVGDFDTMGICRRNEFPGFGVWPPVSGRVDWSDVGEETVAATGDGLNEARILGRVAQRFTDLVDGFIQAVIEVDDRLAPEFLAQLLPGYQLSGFFQEHRENLKRLFLQPDAQATLCQFSGSKIDLEDTKPQPPGWVIVLLHSRHELARTSRPIASTDPPHLRGSDNPRLRLAARPACPVKRLCAVAQGGGCIPKGRRFCWVCGGTHVPARKDCRSIAALPHLITLWRDAISVRYGAANEKSGPPW